MAQLNIAEVSQEVGVSVADVRRAAERIAGTAHCTPVLTCTQLDKLLSTSETQFFFKAELFQKTGSFKFRGAYNAVCAHVESWKGEWPPPPVVAHSSGNHGQALAAAAQLKGVAASIAVPRGASAVKVDAIRGYGAHIAWCGTSDVERQKASRDECERVGGELIHPFLNPHVVAGQGTMALELLDQVKDLDAIVVPIGGGGMVSGITLVAKALKPDIRIFGAEPLRADDAARSKLAGAHLPLEKAPDTIADGVRAGLGHVGWTVVSNLVETIFTVTEEEIVDATKLVWERMKVVAEPTAGVGVAAVRSDAFRSLNLRRVAIILCGGNIDLSQIPWLAK